MSKSILSIRNLAKTFFEDGEKNNVFTNLNLEVKKGEFIVVFGPNGCGKTTLLNIITGLDKKYDGSLINIGNTKIGLVFQNYREALFPWFKVIDNICYPLKLRGVKKDERNNAVLKLIKQLGVSINLYTYPYKLSGGQQQMVAILRALILKPELLLMDEPFSSLDYYNTLLMESKLLSIWEKLGITILMVTHSVDEAIFLSDRIAMFTNNSKNKLVVIKNILPRPRSISAIDNKHYLKVKDKLVNLSLINKSNSNSY